MFLRCHNELRKAINGALAVVRNEKALAYGCLEQALAIKEAIDGQLFVSPSVPYVTQTDNLPLILRSLAICYPLKLGCPAYNCFFTRIHSCPISPDMRFDNANDG
jgi:hypothetical protein